MDSTLSTCQPVYRISVIVNDELISTQTLLICTFVYDRFDWTVTLNKR